MAILAGVSVIAADWPSWRGPRAPAADRRRTCRCGGAPPRTSPGRRRSAGVGVSSPIVTGNRVFVTSQIGTGVRRPATIRVSRRARNARAAGERALDATRRAADNRTFFVVEAFNRADGKRLWEYRVEAAGTAARRARQAQPRVAEPGHRRADGLRLVRHRPDRRARYERQAGLAAASRQGDLAVRHQLGPQQLADAVRGHAAPAVRSRAGVVPARGRQAHRQGALEGRPRQGQALLQHAVRRRRRRPARS